MTYFRTQKIQKVGSSQGFIINKHISDTLQMKPGDEVIAELKDDSIIITRSDMMSKKKEVDAGKVLEPAEPVAPATPATPESGRIEKRIESVERKLDEISKKIDAKKEAGPPAEEIPAAPVEPAPLEPGPINIIEDDPAAPLEPNETPDDGLLFL